MRVSAVLALALLAACSQEPDFDERYDAARDKLDKTASEIDAELKAREKEAEEGVPPPDAAEPGDEIAPAPPDPPA